MSFPPFPSKTVVPPAAKKPAPPASGRYPAAKKKDPESKAKKVVADFFTKHKMGD